MGILLIDIARKIVAEKQYQFIREVDNERPNVKLAPAPRVYEITTDDRLIIGEDDELQERSPKDEGWVLLDMQTASLIKTVCEARPDLIAKFERTHLLVLVDIFWDAVK